MAALVLKAVLDILKHVSYHLLGTLFEKMIEAALQKRRKKRKKARTNDLVHADYTECYTIRSCESLSALKTSYGTCIVLGDLLHGQCVIILIDETHSH